LPLTLFVDAFAASMVMRLRPGSLKWAVVPLIIMLCGWRLAIAADLTYAELHETRYAAAGLAARTHGLATPSSISASRTLCRR
jgi:hypothetical protein